ncbi:LacI family DNA-binding transcriptional regulator [Kribbella sandramycini]
MVNGGPRAVSPAARERVLEAIRVLGYRPNATARALKVGSTRTFGLITPDGGNPLFAELAKAIDRAAAERGYVVLQTSTDGDPATERAKVAELLARQVSGLVLVTPSEAPDLAGAELPVVAVNRMLPGVSSVGPRYREGARTAVEHLIWHGHKRIALVVGAGGAEREQGWRDALGEAGLSADVVERVGFGREGGYEAGLRLVGRRTGVTAVFASSDLQGVGLLRAFHEAGVEMAVVVFDGTPEAEYCWPPLTVVRQPVEVMAAEVVRQLVEGVVPEAVAFPAELVVRRSCGC